MSTIIEATPARRGLPGRLLRSAGLVLLVLLGWLLVLIVLPFLGGSGRQVAVLGDQSRAVIAITSAGGWVVEVRAGAVVARGDGAAFVRRLYASGAPLVLEGRIASGCIGRAGEARAGA